MLVVLPFVTGCDFMRKLAGRPTSEEVENMRLEILRAEEAALEARLDSLRNVEQRMMQDSLNALDSIRQLGGSILNPASLGGLFATRLEARYYVIIGAFRMRANAEQLLLKAMNAGYEPALISFNTGLIAVGLCPCNNVVDAKDALKKVKGTANARNAVAEMIQEAMTEASDTLYIAHADCPEEAEALKNAILSRCSFAKVSVGVIGPTRMDYSRVIGILNHLSEGITDAFDDKDDF